MARDEPARAACGSRARLDLIGLKCPLPVLKTEAALARLAPGEVLEVLADDPLAAIDIPHAVTTAGHALIATSRVGGALAFAIRKGPPSRSGRQAED